MRILFIHQFTFGPSVPGFTRPVEIMSQLMKRKHLTIMISGMFSHITRNKVPFYKNMIFLKDNVLGVTVYRVSGIFKLNSSTKKLFHHLLFMFHSCCIGVFIPSVDIIIASSPSPFAAVAGYILSRLRRVPFVLEIRDLWPEDLMQEGIMKPGIATSLMEKLMRFLYSHSSLIITLTEGIRNGIIRKGIVDTKVVLITNSVSIELFSRQVDTSGIRKEIGVNNEFIVLYAGNHGSSYALENVIEAARLLTNEKEILFLMVGDGEEKDKLIRLTRQYGLQNVKFLASQPKDRMPLIFAMADASLISSRNMPIFEGTIPNKLLDSMASATPVILAMKGEALRIINDSQGGICIEQEDAAQLAKAVLRLAYDKKSANLMGQNGQRYASQNYSHEKLAEKLEKELLDVVARSSN